MMTGVLFHCKLLIIANMSKQGKNGAHDLVIVTGLSGAGMSSVLKSLEDFGYEVIDNCPLSLIDPLLAEKNSKTHRIALGIDTRTRGFSSDSLLETAQRVKAKILFITCDRHELQRRFSETRRRHPMAGDKDVVAGIKQERNMLRHIREAADTVIDTTEFSIHDLRHVLEGHFISGGEKKLTVSLLSFGFKHGEPRGIDMMMDVRFLRNPHWDENLRPKTGRDKAVGKYIEEDPDFEKFMKNFQKLLKPLLPRYIKEGKNYLTIAVGCTGGRHRSVYIVENLDLWLREQGIFTHVVHRDLEK